MVVSPKPFGVDGAIPFPSLLMVGFGFSGVALAAQDSLDPSKCNAAWNMASPNGETLPKGKAVDYVINFSMVDSNQDGQISADEFNKACNKGLVKADAATAKDMQ
jgi:hypothetical protein